VRRKDRKLGIILIAAAALLPAVAFARPLDTTTCEQLDKEKAILELAGVTAELHAKPDDAKALAADKLKRIQRYVQVSADVLFRCPIPVVIIPTAPAVTSPEVAVTAPKEPGKVAETVPATSAGAKPDATPAVAKEPAAAKPHGSKAKKPKR
jgi:hypothetical protein